MFKKLNKKGFTLAELLIVVAIIGVLVAISIPIFTAQLQKARFATNQANARAAYAAAVAAYLEDDTVSGGNYNVKTGEFTKGSPTAGTLDMTTLPGTWDLTTTPALGTTVYKDNIGITMSSGEITKFSLK